MTPEEMEVQLKAVTDSLQIIDKVIKAAGLGVDMVPVFQCSHSGLYYPLWVVKEWGVRFGVGLGPDPCSECLDSEYEIAPPDITPQIRDILQIMHPVRVTKAQLDLDLVEASVYKSKQAILAIDDPWMEKRAMIVRGKQLLNARGRLRTMQAAWEKTSHPRMEVA